MLTDVKKNKILLSRRLILAYYGHISNVHSSVIVMAAGLIEMKQVQTKCLDGIE